ncbi:MAG: hypothetical protein KDD59_14260 [Bdellovibrionales bacterium]|nr:hypothetical protein [Bdellovibrionales bacterium]
MKKIFLYSLLIFSSLSAWARPEYAARARVTRCTACHVSPGGGSLRNSYGKLYGARGFKQSQFAKQDLISADARMLYFKPEDHHSQNGGLFMMTGIVGANVPINEADESSPELRLVLSHNVASSSPSPWDNYLRIKRFDDTEVKWSPQYITVGRFHTPFGVVHDEHRTYTRMQTASEWNKHLEGGLMLSGDPLESLHYDLAAVNGKNTGANYSAGQATLWGALLNMRWTSPYSWLPLVLGASGKHYDKEAGKKNPWATSFYTILPFDRIAGGFVKGSLMIEQAQARYLNDDFTTSFVSNAALQTSVAQSESIGQLYQLDFQVTPKLFLQFKYDRLALDKDFTGDAFERTGFGIKHFMAANTFFTLRHETASVGASEDPNGSARGANDLFFMMFQTGL